mgnify:CR=1 FL=1
MLHINFTYKFNVTSEQRKRHILSFCQNIFRNFNFDFQWKWHCFFLFCPLLSPFLLFFRHKSFSQTTKNKNTNFNYYCITWLLDLSTTRVQRMVHLSSLNWLIRAGYLNNASLNLLHYSTQLIIITTGKYDTENRNRNDMSFISYFADQLSSIYSIKCT